MKHETRFLLIAIAEFILDRLSKWYVATLSPGEGFSFLGIDFGYFLNPSLFFLPVFPWIQWLALAVLIILILYSQSKTNLILNPYNLIPIIFGGISNVFDRFMYGGVIDVIHIRGLATINIADVLIFVGIVGLIKSSWRR